MKNEFNIGGRKVGELILIQEKILLAAGNQAMMGISKNCPVRIKVVDFWVYQEAAGPASSSTLQLRHGDGAASESFNAISNALAIGTNSIDTVVRATTLDGTYTIIEVGDSLNLLAVASSGSHDAQVNILCLVIEE